VGYFLLARALQQSGRPQDADAAMQRARQLSDNFEQLEKATDALLAK